MEGTKYLSFRLDVLYLYLTNLDEAICPVRLTHPSYLVTAAATMQCSKANSHPKASDVRARAFILKEWNNTDDTILIISTEATHKSHQSSLFFTNMLLLPCAV